MRAHSVVKESRPPLESADNGSPPLARNIARLLGEMTSVVGFDPFRWREPLRLLLTHPCPTTVLREFHESMRAAIRRSRYNEAFVDRLLGAVTAAEREHGLGDLLAPIRLAVVAFIGGISRRPSVLMTAAREFIAGTDLDLPLSLSFATIAKSHRLTSMSKHEAMACVTRAVQRTVAALLEERAIGEVAFAAWRREDCLAGLEALWLAFTYCEVGTANCGKPSKAELRRDLERCGTPLWQQLDRALVRATVAQISLPTAHKLAEFGRLSLAVQSAASPGVASPDGMPGASSANLMHVVCRTPIPDSTDKQDIQEITRHRVLEEPLPVARMPSISLLAGYRAQLLAEFPWAGTVLDVIFDDLVGRANLGVLELTLPPTLLIGMPGAGKSRLARRIAEQLALPRLDVCLGGNSDTKLIGGTSRGWATGRPSDLASLLARGRTASAFVILDELDKATDSHRSGGGIDSFLLGLLEPETSCRHYDSFLKTECDFSKVSWLCTANALRGISRPLQSRLRILQVPQPRREDLPSVCAAVIAELEQRWQVPTGTIPSVGELDFDIARITSARQARAATEAAVSLWARSVVRH